MPNDKEAVCQGCGKKAGEMRDYMEDNPVQEDGTYANHKFVCNTCYCELINLGLDIGEPEQLQMRARLNVRKRVK